MWIAVAILAASGVLAAGCASIERFTQLLQAVPPAGAIVLSGFRDIFIGKPYRITGKPYRSIYLDHWRVADGHYNRRAIEARVEEPKACN